MWVDMGRLWCCISKVSLLETFLRMVRNTPEIEAEESNNLSMNTWNMGDEPVTGKPYADFVEENASSWRVAWQNVFGEDAVIRTDERWDGTVKHLGYHPVTVSYYVKDTLSKVILTDAKLIKASQERLREAKVIPDNELTARQRAHINLARAIVQDTCRYSPITAVHAALIPPASDRVRTAGMYGRITQEIFIASDQLERGSATVDTVIHEIAHHTSGAEDLDQAHSSAMTQVAARVVKATATGDFDDLLKEAVW
jgi:23S rRNA U2552 (ribose-2'-O)-methylase RlmE/FtsJ